jgi:hypothetical protein
MAQFHGAIPWRDHYHVNPEPALSQRPKSAVQAAFSAARLGGLMAFAERFAVIALVVLTLAPARAADSGRPAHAGPEPAHACLNQKERQAEVDARAVVPLATAMHAVKHRMPGTVVRARLCRSHDGLVYVLTVLGHDGKVARLTVDAVKGTLVGGL